jgi:hypothetical protein
MGELAEYVDDLPNLCGSEQRIQEAVVAGRARPVFLGRSSVDIAGTDSAFAVALHMHQPLIPAGGPDPRTAAIVSNLQWMLEHPELGDNHDAPVFHWCYQRMGELIAQLLAEGSQPRIMLEYSGTLLHGLRRAGLDDVFDALRPLTCDPDLRQAVEWLGCSWGHAVAPPLRCRITGCTCGPGSTTSRPSSAWRRWGGCVALPRRRWRCPTTPTWPMRSSRP